MAFSFEDYLELIDWSGRAVRLDKTGSIPENAPRILSRLNFSQQAWLKLMPEVEKRFNVVIGRKQVMQAFAEKLDLAWLHGQRYAPT